jgi:exopolyphosphatase/guanosine-5'-triphosphate,3'-diphosphate pyrophosphatase
LPLAWREDALRLVMLLRLAVLLNRSRNNTDLPDVGLAVGDNTLHLTFDREWLAANALTAADLQREQNYLTTVGYELTFG